MTSKPNGRSGKTHSNRTANSDNDEELSRKQSLTAATTRVSVSDVERAAAMSFKANTFRVMIASPSDLAEERLAATEAINDFNDQHSAAEGVVLLPVKWETHATPQAGIRPQEAINEQLVQKCDILVGLFWTKI